MIESWYLKEFGMGETNATPHWLAQLWHRRMLGNNSDVTSVVVLSECEHQLAHYLFVTFRRAFIVSPLGLIVDMSYVNPHNCENRANMNGSGATFVETHMRSLRDSLHNHPQAKRAPIY